MDTLFEMASDPDVIFVAHNAYFERKIWRAKMVPLGFPDIPRERWKCTMAKAVAHGLPASLDQVARALNLSVKKDMAGHKMMLKLCKPKKDGTFWREWEVPEDFEVLYDYCIGDVFAERQLDKRLKDLSKSEKRVWEIDQRINDDGVWLDLPLIRKAIVISEEHKKRIKNAFSEVTGSDFSPRQRGRFKDWLFDNGVVVDDTKKTTLEKTDTENHLVSEAIRLVGESNKTSLAKYPAMLMKSDAGGRARELLAYHSAHTGRWGGRGIQVQNLPHTKFGMDALCNVLEVADYDYFCENYFDVVTPLSSGLRGMIIPEPGYDFIVGDYKSIEAVALAWLAGNFDKLDDFNAGRDLYCAAATPIFGRVITPEMKDERSVGKVGELALGYEGGIAAYVNMSVSYRVDLTPVIEPLMKSATSQEWEDCAKSYLLYLKRIDEENKKLKAKKKALKEPAPKMLCYTADLIKQRWRVKNAKIVQFWKDQQAAAILAVKSGKVIECGWITWFVNGDFLYARLPTGRDIRYPFPKVSSTGRSDKLTFWTVNSLTKKWSEEDTYGGKLTENIVQGLCRDIMVFCMKDIEDSMYKTRFTVHDELITMVPHGKGSAEELQGYMEQPIECLPGFPIRAECWRGPRYEKR
jgi:DNA polymerase